MGLLNRIFGARPRRDPIRSGRVSSVNVFDKTLPPYRSRTTNVLRGLRMIRDEANAIDFLYHNSPDVSMAVWNFLRMANQGHEMHFYDMNDKKKVLPEIEAEWKMFASRVNAVSNSGLDGLIDIFHRTAFMRGGQGAEVEVNKTRTDIIDVHPIIPQTVTWELEERNNRQVWIPYQQQALKKVSLEPGKANFFWVPTDPGSDDPRGTLTMSPVLQAIDFQLQVLQDLQAVLHHQGFQKNDIKILLERVVNAMPPQIKGAGPEKQQEWLDAQWNNVVNMLNQMEPDSDYIHYDDIEISMSPGANAGRGLDARAIMELVDTQVLNGLKQLGTFSNRHTGKTETYSSVEMKIYVQGILSIQRGSKRLVEEVARLWLRVRGLQAVPVFTHNVVDWQSEIDKWDVAIMKEQHAANAQGLGWISPDEAAMAGIGVKKAYKQVQPEQVPVKFGKINSGGGNDGRESNKTAQKATSRAGSRIEPQEDA